MENEPTTVHYAAYKMNTGSSGNKHKKLTNMQLQLKKQEAQLSPKDRASVLSVEIG